MLKKYSHYFNKLTSLPVKTPVINEASVSERNDLVPITEEQYSVILGGTFNNKKYYYNGVTVNELPEPSRSPKWFERIEYDTSRKSPIATIVSKPMSEIKNRISGVRKSKIDGDARYNDRLVNALREMLDSSIDSFVYVDPTSDTNKSISREQAMALYRDALTYRQTQFLIEDAYARAYELGHAIPDPSVVGNWDINVINELMVKPIKPKRNKA